MGASKCQKCEASARSRTQWFPGNKQGSWCAIRGAVTGLPPSLDASFLHSLAAPLVAPPGSRPAALTAWYVFHPPVRLTAS